MTSDVGRREKLRALREGRIEIEDLYGLLDELDESDSTCAEPDVARLLEHENPIVRYTAIGVLAYRWEMRDYREKLVAMLANDPDADVSHTAASALGWLLRGSRDAAATELLLKKIRSDDENKVVREMAYGALLDIWLQPAGRALTLTDLRPLVDRLSKNLERTSALARDLDRAVDAGDTAKADAIRAELGRPDESWKERVDWDVVAAIERGEIPTPQKPS